MIARITEQSTMSTKRKTRRETDGEAEHIYFMELIESRKKESIRKRRGISR